MYYHYLFKIDIILIVFARYYARSPSRAFLVPFFYRSICDLSFM